MGFAVCDATPGPGGEVICNFADDDCVGAVDDGFADVEGRYTLDVEHCGGAWSQRL